MAIYGSLVGIFGYVTRAVELWHEQAGGALLLTTGGWMGSVIGVTVPKQQARLVFVNWIRVLPLDAKYVTRFWRQRSARHTVFRCALITAALSIAGVIGGVNITSVATVALFTVMSTSVIAALVLYLNPWQSSNPGTRKTAGYKAARVGSTTVAVFEPAQACHLGLWQLRTQWRQWMAVVFGAASFLTLIFAIAIARSQGHIIPIFAVALLISITMFNKSLDGRILLSPVFRLLPLSRSRRIWSFVQSATVSSFIVLIMCSLTVLLVGPNKTSLTQSLFLWSVVILAWFLLVILRVVVCIGHPAGGLRADIEYVCILAAISVMIQTLGPAGPVFAVLGLTWLLKQRAGRL